MKWVKTNNKNNFGFSRESHKWLITPLCGLFMCYNFIIEVWFYMQYSSNLCFAFVLVFTFPCCFDFINFYLFFLILKFWMFKEWQSQGLVENLVNQGLFWYLINFSVLKTIEIDGGCGVLICILFFRVLKFKHCLKNNRIMVFAFGV
jgi:hypothetical protein